MAFQVKDLVSHLEMKSEEKDEEKDCGGRTSTNKNTLEEDALHELMAALRQKLES